MLLNNQFIEQTQLVIDVLQTITQNIYSEKQDLLGGSSIGQHVRHIIEINEEFLVNNGKTIDYENRKRDYDLEQFPLIAAQKCIQQLEQLRSIDLSESAVLSYFEEEISSTKNRELMYLIEHTIHHLAIIKITLRYLKCDTTPDHFGLAYSTLKFKACAR